MGWGGDVNVRLKLNTPLMLRWACTGLHAQWSLKLARRKKVRISCGRVAKRKKNDIFFKTIFTLRRLRNTERVVIFWQWWCAYTRDSAPGGMYIYVYVYVYVYVYTYVSKYVCMYVRTYVCMFVCMYVCLFVCLYVCMFLCMYVCMYVCMFVCMYVCLLFSAWEKHPKNMSIVHNPSNIHSESTKKSPGSTGTVPCRMANLPDWFPAGASL